MAGPVVRELTIKWTFQYDKSKMDELKKQITEIKNLATSAGNSLAGMSNKIQKVALASTEAIKSTTQAVKELQKVASVPMPPLFFLQDSKMASLYADMAKQMSFRKNLPSVASSYSAAIKDFFPTVRGGGGVSGFGGLRDYSSWAGPRGLLGRGVNPLLLGAGGAGGGLFGGGGGGLGPVGMQTVNGGWRGPVGLLPGGSSPTRTGGFGGGYYRILRDTNTIYSQTLASKIFEGIPGAFKSMTGGAGGLAKSLSTPLHAFGGIPMIGGLAAGGGLFSTLKESLRGYSEITALQHSLAQVTGSPQTAGMLVGQARQYTREVPGADLEETVKNMHIFLGSGVAAGDVMGRMRKITDLSSMFSANFTRIAADFAKIQQRGYMTGYEFTSFIRNKIPMNKAIADVLGVKPTVVPGLVKDKAITNEIVLAALNKLAGPGGIAYGFSSQRAKTPEGQMQIFHQVFKDFERTVGGMVAPTATKALESLGAWFDANKEKFATELSKVFDLMIEALPILAKFAGFMLDNWDILLAYLGVLVALQVIANAQAILIASAIWGLYNFIVKPLASTMSEPRNMAMPLNAPGYNYLPAQAYQGLMNMQVNNHIMIDGSNLDQDQLTKAVTAGLDNHTKKTYFRAAHAFNTGVDTTSYAPTGR